MKSAERKNDDFNGKIRHSGVFLKDLIFYSHNVNLKTRLRRAKTLSMDKPVILTSRHGLKLGTYLLIKLNQLFCLHVLYVMVTYGTFSKERKIISFIHLYQYVASDLTVKLTEYFFKIL